VGPPASLPCCSPTKLGPTPLQGCWEGRVQGWSTSGAAEGSQPKQAGQGEGQEDSWHGWDVTSVPLLDSGAAGASTGRRHLLPLRGTAAAALWLPIMLPVELIAHLHLRQTFGACQAHSCYSRARRADSGSLAPHTRYRARAAGHDQERSARAVAPASRPSSPSLPPAVGRRRPCRHEGRPFAAGGSGGRCRRP